MPGTPTTSHGFVVKVTSGGQACSGALVDPLWVLTSASCAKGDERVGGAATAKVVRHGDRDVALLKLAVASTATPIAVSTTAPSVGEALKVGGWGRTATEWVPDKASIASFTVASVSLRDVALTGDRDTCKGDAGGPAFREVAGVPQLVALNRVSWQHGCFGESETRKGSTETRVDDLAGWVAGQLFDLTATPAPRNAINLTWAARGHSSFKVYASESETGPFTVLGTVGTTSFTHAALTARKTWHYRVAGVRDGQEFASATVSATTKLPMRSDFSGDGVDDVAAAYDMGSFKLGLPVWNGGQDGLGAPAVKFESAPDQFDNNRARWVSGDFNGDGKADAAAFYNYAHGETKLLVFYANASGFGTWEEKWTGGLNNPTSASSKVVAGDFNADGRADIGAFYDVGGNQTKLFVWYGTATGFEPPAEKWDSGPGRADVVAFYNLDNGLTQSFLWKGNTTGFDAPAQQWDGGVGNWPAQSAKLF